MVCLYVFPQDYLSASTDLQEVLQLDLNVQGRAGAGDGD